MRVAVIGAGPSGMMAAIFAAKNGHSVFVIEKNEKVGKKLYITGKGRCNVTNNVFPREFLDNVFTNPKFLYSAINKFTPQDTIDFFEQQGLNLKTERGNRVFPQSDKASDISRILFNSCIQNNVEFLFNHNVLSIKKQNKLFFVETNKINMQFDAVIICSGGLSYPTTGSTGDGYNFAKKLGHTIVSPVPSLCPIILKDDWIKSIEGLTLKNVELMAYDKHNKLIKSEFGEMLFTRNGISGPIVLTITGYINRKTDVNLFLDFKPALSYEKLEERILRDFKNNAKSQINSVLKGLLPANFVPIFLRYCQLTANTKVSEITQLVRKNIVSFLKRFPLKFDKLSEIDYAIVTSGGINVSEINPQTMQSKLITNLFFAGEVIDVDAQTGGFNIQIALSTGFIAGKSVGG